MSLAAAINSSLRTGAMNPDFINHLLTRDKMRAKNKNETEYWDYKETIDVSSPEDVAKLAKRVLGFHNNKGGAIIYGISDDFIVRGISANQLLDSKQVNDKLRPYVGPRVTVFQDSIDLKGGKTLWFVFVPKRIGLPVAIQRDGPQDAKGKTEVKKNSFYLRVNDEFKTCLDPVDLCALFADVDASLQSAYAFDVDEPYFRLLAHHCDRFVGRQSVLDDVREALSLRHPIVSFDGLGGVGKSAIAIELTRQLYESREYQFIISMSAKSRVWQGHVATRIAGFSGITEFLREIASVIGVEPNQGIDDLRSDIVSAMRGLPGLILVDNIEDVHDEQILKFLSREVPDPVKTIVTSRIDRGLGAVSVSIPEMTDSEARDLFEHELQRQGFSRKFTDTSTIKRILEATGLLPLAIKWAASIAAKSQSLVAAERIFDGCPAEKKEFLSYCFKTMYDQLPTLARQVGLLYPYLDESWTLPVLSIALDSTEQEIVEALHELKDRGIALATNANSEQMPRMLPLTRDFLATKLREDRSIEATVEARLAKALGDANPLLAGIGSARRVELLLTAIKRKLSEGDLEEAERLLKHTEDVSNDGQGPWLAFLCGQLEFLKGKRSVGRQLMEEAVRNTSDKQLLNELEQRLGLLLIEADAREERQIGATYLLRTIAKGTDVPIPSFSRIVEISLRQNDYQSLRALLSCRLKPAEALEILRALEPALNRDLQLQYQLGPDLIEVYEGALRLRGGEVSEADRTKFNARAAASRRALKLGG